MTFILLNGLILWVFTEMCNHDHCGIPKHFHHPPRKCYTHLQALALPQLLALANLLSVSVSAYSGPFVQMESYKTWYFVSGFFYVVCFQKFIHILLCISISFLLWPNNTLSYGDTAF